MQPNETLTSEGHHDASHNIVGNLDASRSRPQRVRKSQSLPGPLGTRYDFGTYSKSRGNNLNGRPNVYIYNEKGQSRPADHGDYWRGSTTASESRGSEEGSSILKVSDLGFGTASKEFPTFPCASSSCGSAIYTSLEDVIRERKKGHALRSQSRTKAACIQSRLYKEIESALKWSEFDNYQYLPLDSFESIFNARSIATLLDEQYCMTKDEELRKKFESIVNPVLGRYRRRILGILVFMSHVEHIESFIREDIWDDDLPLERPAGNRIGRFRTRISENDSLMQDWRRDDIELFCLYQRMFFVPFFDIRENQLCAYELGFNIRLPWKTYDYKTNGGSGIIHKVEIHPSHHNFSRPNSKINPVFALKAIEAGGHQAYSDELSALEKSCAKAQEEKHLIKLLLTFRHQDKFYLLFEWADGNLEEFWEKHPSKPPSFLDERWAAEQCLGLAKAVIRIHGLTTWQKEERSSPAGSFLEADRDWGRHGDIKPENILWFKEHLHHRNLLVMSDLGLTRYHSQFSKSIIPRSHIDGYSSAYRPPELDMDERISQKYDIWSLGCVFLEFCVWYLQGHDEVEHFRWQRYKEDLWTYEGVESEKFFNVHSPKYGHKEPYVKKAVKERLETLRGLSIHTTFAKGLLHVIEKNMLQCASDNRTTIDIIKRELLMIFESIPKAPNSGLLSRGLAHIRRDNSAPPLSRPRKLSLNDENRKSTTDSPDTLIANETNIQSVVWSRFRSSKSENGQQNEGRENLPWDIGVEAISNTAQANAAEATYQQGTERQLPETRLKSEDKEVSYQDAAIFHVPGRHSPTTKSNKIKQRISQKSRKWFWEPLIQLKNTWKG
ncbi:kinase-like protein [Alternaria alternata]|nr:kinase-like protein [Alternaria alternata]